MMLLDALQQDWHACLNFNCKDLRGTIQSS